MHIVCMYVCAYVCTVCVGDTLCRETYKICVAGMHTSIINKHKKMSLHGFHKMPSWAFENTAVKLPPKQCSPRGNLLKICDHFGDVLHSINIVLAPKWHSLKAHVHT